MKGGLLQTDDARTHDRRTDMEIGIWPMHPSFFLNKVLFDNRLAGRYIHHHRHQSHASKPLMHKRRQKVKIRKQKEGKAKKELWKKRKCSGKKEKYRGKKRKI